eukprot:TRINITY_DN1972_c0_g1_i13.p1 TRINITY_DN1972_c0_g1~~TRINITY_DN1972_c0_g1_i13.p1  ORF type:complete len:149 (+),score=17.89 TRINITY_DN1972_c0_g1_i13:660-1106(+)
MRESVTEQCRVWDEGALRRKPLSGPRTNDQVQRKGRLNSCQQPRQDEWPKRQSESLGLKRAQADLQASREMPRLNRGIAGRTVGLEAGRGVQNCRWSGEMRRYRQECRRRRRHPGPVLTLMHESVGSKQDQIPWQSTPQTMHTRSEQV